MIISILSQKGGVGKSSIARTLAVEFTRAEWQVLLADTDHGQTTCHRWNTIRRSQARLEPVIQTESFPTVQNALSKARSYDLLIIDGAPHSTSGTREAAKHSDLILIPTGSSIDDLEPAITLHNDLAIYENSKIAFIMMKTTSDRQEDEARETLLSQGFEVVNGSIQMKTGYITALDTGRCLTETPYAGLNEKVMRVINDIASRISE